MNEEELEKELRAFELWRWDMTDGMSRMLDVLHTQNELLRGLTKAVNELTKVERPEPPDPKANLLLDENQLSEMIGVPVSSIRKWRVPYSAGGPAFMKVGSRVRYHRKEVLEWIEREQQSAALPEHWYGQISPRVGTARRPVERKKETCPGTGGEPKRTHRMGTVERGVCGVCGTTDVTLTGRGLLFKHSRSAPAEDVCAGSYREPREHVQDRGTCMACGGNIGLMADGKVRKHKSQRPLK